MTSLRACGTNRKSRIEKQNRCQVLLVLGSSMLLLSLVWNLALPILRSCGFSTQVLAFFVSNLKPHLCLFFLNKTAAVIRHILELRQFFVFLTSGFWNQLLVWKGRVLVCVRQRNVGVFSETYTFVLTASDGGKQYGYCRRYLPPGDKPRTAEAFCIISRLYHFLG